MNATLPEGFEAPTIARMKTGETRYTTPWAMEVDGERGLWLNPDYPAERRSSGTIEMRIKRERDGFHVWAVPDFYYAPHSGDCRQDRLPVVHLNTESALHDTA